MKRPAGRKFSFALSAAWALAAGFACRSYVPARFVAREPVVDARDDGQQPLPRVLSVPEPVYLSEVHLHRPLREALYLTSYPQAKDTNAFDEVPRSTWFEPRAIDIGTMARGPDDPGMPHPPFAVLPDEPLALAAGGLSIRDARGQLYEIAVDPADRPEMRTGALAVAAKLVWALGLNTPPVMVTHVRFDDFQLAEGAKRDALLLLKAGPEPVGGYYRVAAVAWPEGQNLGRSPEMGTRGDDANDVIAHEDRRTMRALKVFASWLALSGLGPAKTLDRYLGAPGEGHVVHYLVGLDDALGASNVVRLGDPPPKWVRGSAFMRLLTLGLVPSRPRVVTQDDIPAVGGLSDEVHPENFDLPLPYAPADRLVASDGYWAAKRIGVLSALSSSPYISLAIEAGKFSDLRAQETIRRALETRGRAVASYWFSRVVPLDLLSFAGARLELIDEAIALALEAPDVTDYRLDFVDGNAEPVAEQLWVHPLAAKVTVDLPEAALRAANDYLVIQILGRRHEHWLPRMVEVHIRPVGGIPAVVGIRH
jgi:hypothetical protein